MGRGKTAEQCFNRWHEEFKQAATSGKQQQQLLGHFFLPPCGEWVDITARLQIDAAVFFARTRREREGKILLLYAKPGGLHGDARHNQEVTPPPLLTLENGSHGPCPEKPQSPESPPNRHRHNPSRKLVFLRSFARRFGVGAGKKAAHDQVVSSSAFMPVCRGTTWK